LNYDCRRSVLWDEAVAQQQVRSKFAPAHQSGICTGFSLEKGINSASLEGIDDPQDEGRRWSPATIGKQIPHPSEVIQERLTWKIATTFALTMF